MGEPICKLLASGSELKEAFAVRKEVFVEEQGVAEYLEFDGNDEQALHVVAMDEGRVIGTARVMFPDANRAKIERMAVLKPFRRKGIGKKLICYLTEYLGNRQVAQVVLHAQYSVVGFYQSCGFEESGPIFWEAGIKHIKMQRQL